MNYHAEIQLQAWMTCTVRRLLNSLEGVEVAFSNAERTSLLLICKWGYDGRQQSEYEKTFKNDTDSYATIFQSSFELLRLVVQANKKFIWSNPIEETNEILNGKHYGTLFVEML